MFLETDGACSITQTYTMSTTQSTTQAKYSFIVSLFNRVHVDQSGMLFYGRLEAILSLRKRHLPKVLPIEAYQIEDVIDYCAPLWTAIHQPFQNVFSLRPAP